MPQGGYADFDFCNDIVTTKILPHYTRFEDGQ